MTPEVRKRLASAIAKKAWDLYQLLSEAMARQNVDLSTIDLPGEKHPGESKIERLRRYFNMVTAAQRRSTTDDFGLCLACGGPIPLPLLQEMPWREYCPACDNRAPSPGGPGGT